MLYRAVGTILHVCPLGNHRVIRPLSAVHDLRKRELGRPCARGAAKAPPLKRMTHWTSPALAAGQRPRAVLGFAYHECNPWALWARTFGPWWTFDWERLLAAHGIIIDHAALARYREAQPA